MIDSSKNFAGREKASQIDVTSRNQVSSEADRGMETVDPLAAFLSDPESHLSDILYLYFRTYKKRLLWNFLRAALAQLSLDKSQALYLADVGASTGFDVLYLLRRLTGNFREPAPYDKVFLSLVEGDQELAAGGERNLRMVLTGSQFDFKYHHYPLVEGLPLSDDSQHLIICSEVVEHLEEPAKLLQEIVRVLKPGGFLILTTDNSPSLLQRMKRIPVWLSGQYQEVYARPSKECEVVAKTLWNDRAYPIFGHINLNPTRHWEKLCAGAGFALTTYGTYESIRRGGGSKSPLALAGYFIFGALVYHLMPKSIGRFFGDTTALLLRNLSPSLQK